MLLWQCRHWSRCCHRGIRRLRRCRRLSIVLDVPKVQKDFPSDSWPELPTP